MTDSHPPRRILIIRPSALGDVCRTVPVLVSIRRAWPESTLDWVVRDSFLPAIAAHPALDEVIPFPRARLARWWCNPRAAREAYRWFSDLRRRRYDLVLDCQGLGRSGLIAWATRAPRRVGFAGARELAWLGYNVRHPRQEGVHTVDEMLALVAAEGIEPEADMRLYLADEDRDAWASRRSTLGVRDAPYAVLAPTARWASKRWPVERWCELVTPLLTRGVERVVVIGGPDEREQVRALVAGTTTGLVDLVGRTSLGEMMAIVAGAALVVANDSAPLHMAIGFDRPTVGLFGPTEPEIVGPYRHPEAVVRGFLPEPGQTINYRDPKLGDALMRSIGVDAVLERIDAVSAAGPQDAGGLRIAASAARGGGA